MTGQDAATKFLRKLMAQRERDMAIWNHAWTVPPPDEAASLNAALDEMVAGLEPDETE